MLPALAVPPSSALEAAPVLLPLPPLAMPLDPALAGIDCIVLPAAELPATEVFDVDPALLEPESARPPQPQADRAKIKTALVDDMLIKFCSFRPNEQMTMNQTIL
jgi:hypothetical protein